MIVNIEKFVQLLLEISIKNINYIKRHFRCELNIAPNGLQIGEEAETIT